MKNKVNEIVINKCFSETVEQEQRLQEDLGIDSLGLVELLTDIENEFNIEIDESDLDPDSLRTVENLYALVEKYIGREDNAL